MGQGIGTLCRNRCGGGVGAICGASCDNSLGVDHNEIDPLEELPRLVPQLPTLEPFRDSEEMEDLGPTSPATGSTALPHGHETGLQDEGSTCTGGESEPVPTRIMAFAHGGGEDDGLHELAYPPYSPHWQQLNGCVGRWPHHRRPAEEWHTAEVNGWRSNSFSDCDPVSEDMYHGDDGPEVWVATPWCVNVARSTPTLMVRDEIEDWHPRDGARGKLGEIAVVIREHLDGEEDETEGIQPRTLSRRVDQGQQGPSNPPESGRSADHDSTTKLESDALAKAT